MNKEKKAHSKIGDPYKRKKIISIAVLVVGVVTLIAGLVVMILGINKGSGVADGEYLVAAEDWVLEDCDRVIWDFTEIGKGTLTTNAHENDYDFSWAIEDGKLLIQTEWLYEMHNEYDYTLDQSNGILTLTHDEETYRFVAQ